jgi:hypothetical protein
VSSCCDDPLFGPVALKTVKSDSVLLAFDGVVITLAGSRLRMKNLGHNFGRVRLLVYFLFCDTANGYDAIENAILLVKKINKLSRSFNIRGERTRNIYRQIQRYS